MPKLIIKDYENPEKEPIGEIYETTISPSVDEYMVLEGTYYLIKTVHHDVNIQESTYQITIHVVLTAPPRKG